MSHFDYDEKSYKIEELTQKTMEGDFWSDADQAQRTIRQLNSLKEVVDAYDSLQKSIASLQESAQMLKE